MAKRWFPTEVMRAVASAFSFADSDAIRYFEGDSLGKAVDVVESRRGNVD